MRGWLGLALAACLAACLAVPVVGRGQDDGRTADIKAMMEKSAADWNKGDIDAFATAYKNSPDILFMGAVIQKGYAAMVARYKQAYPTPEKMGTLSFSRVEVQPLDEKFATVTGRYHLERTGDGGGNDDGYYLLVVEKTKDGWKIVRDDSSALPKPRAAVAK